MPTTRKVKTVPAWLKAWCAASGHGGVVAEHKFHPTRKWALDFAFPAFKVGIEIHGSVWTQGRHTRGGGFLNDREKMNAAQALGWKVGEFTYGQEAEAVAWLEKVLGDA